MNSKYEKYAEAINKCKKDRDDFKASSESNSYRVRKDEDLEIDDLETDEIKCDFDFPMSINNMNFQIHLRFYALTQSDKDDNDIISEINNEISARYMTGFFITKIDTDNSEKYGDIHLVNQNNDWTLTDINFEDDFINLNPEILELMISEINKYWSNDIKKDVYFKSINEHLRWSRDWLNHTRGRMRSLEDFENKVRIYEKELERISVEK